MSPINNIFRLNCSITGNYKNVLLGGLRLGRPSPVTNSLSPLTQICAYTKKSAEEKLGIEKPKRPLTPFFKFMTQMRPALLAKNPGISSKEAIAWSSKHWQELDSETKSQMHKEFEKDMEDYKKIKEIYESSLTDQQKEDIKQLKDEMNAAKEKRKLKAEYRELGRPKKPMSSYLLFCQSRKDTFQGKKLKEFQETIKNDWLKLSESERAKYEKQAQELMKKFKKELEAWEIKMVSIGRSDLVQQKTLRQKTPKSEKKSQ